MTEITIGSLVATAFLAMELFPYRQEESEKRKKAILSNDYWPIPERFRVSPEKRAAFAIYSNSKKTNHDEEL